MLQEEDVVGWPGIQICRGSIVPVLVIGGGPDRIGADGGQVLASSRTSELPRPNLWDEWYGDGGDWCVGCRVRTAGW